VVNLDLIYKENKNGNNYDSVKQQKTFRDNQRERDNQHEKR